MPHGHRISRLGFVNSHLVEEDDGITVIDTMIPGSAKAITAAAAELGKPITRIVLTHAHGDHIGSLDALAEAHPDAEVVVSARDERLLRKDRSPDPGEPEGKYRGGYPGADAAVDVALVGGERVGSLEAIPTTGHTPGHMAFLDTRDRTLYCGDVFSTLGGVATTAKPNWRFPFPGMATWNRELELESARALRALEPAALAPGHGKVIEAPGAAMDAAIAQAS